MATRMIEIVYDKKSKQLWINDGGICIEHYYHVDSLFVRETPHAEDDARDSIAAELCSYNEDHFVG
jgi:hypothetical protein